MKKFPKKIYINWVHEGLEDQYLDTVEKIENIDENVKEVAIYELKEVKTLKVTRELK